jgi:hypothetical protein
VASPGGQYVALPGDSLRILRTTDYSLVYTFPQRTYGGHFGLSEDRYYYAFDGVVNVIELSDPYGAPRVVFTNEGYLSRVLTTPDESKWIMYGTLNMYQSIFLVYDAEKDSVIFSYPHTPGHGDIALSRDGKLAFFTNPGNLTGALGDSHITVFDVEANRIDRMIPTFQYEITTQPPDLWMRSMIVTPDNRWLIALEEFTTPSFFRYDLKEEREVSWRLIRKGIEKMSIQSMR